MTPPRLDFGVIRQKLALIEDSLATLDSLGVVDADRLKTDEVIAAAVERLLSRVVDLAVDVNSHVVAVIAGRGPGEYAESFRMAAEIGMINRDLADELFRSVGLRNVIVHQYVELDPNVIASAIPMALSGYRSYVSLVAAYVMDHENG